MKYVLYIDYSASYKPMTSEYRKLEAKTLSDAILEADKQYDPDTMYLMRIIKSRIRAVLEKVLSEMRFFRRRFKDRRDGLQQQIGLYRKTRQGEGCRAVFFGRVGGKRSL